MDQSAHFFDRTRAVRTPSQRFVVTSGFTLALALTLVSFRRCAGAPNEVTTDAAPALLLVADAGSVAAADATASFNDAALAPLPPRATSVAPTLCRLAYGPAEQVFRGPAALRTTKAELQLIANDGGKPRRFSVPLGAPPPASVKVPVVPTPLSFVAMRWPPCELAGRWAYCPAAGGDVYRTTLGANDTKFITKSQGGTRLAAAALGEGHAVVATLDTRRTTEGAVMQAFVTLDEGETTRLSDDGAGATVIRVVSRGETAMALYLDARSGMAPVHARPLALRGSYLVLGEDVVVFVGGPPERGVDLTPAVSGSRLFALVPIAREISEFGMATLPIDDPAKGEVEASWSLYPNGLDPAPLGASVASGEGDAGIRAGWVARVRPFDGAPGASRVLELGRLDATGTFTSLGIISEGKPITDIAVLGDAYGTVWVLYGDSRATWLERRVCL